MTATFKRAQTIALEVNKALSYIVCYVRLYHEVTPCGSLSICV